MEDIRNASANTARLLLIFLICGSILLWSTPANSSEFSLKPPSAKIRNPGTITLPKTFEKVWYRDGAKGFSFKAYSASGRLVITEQVIEFRAKKISFDVPVNNIQGIHWGQMRGDKYNDWAILVYEIDGIAKTAGFKDGRNLGNGKDADLFFSTIKYAAEVIGGMQATVDTTFASGWVDITLGGLMSTENQKLALSLMLGNKSNADLWVQVKIDTPDSDVACDSVKKLAVKGATLFSCPQDAIVAERVYPVYISVFTDEKQSKLVEKSGTRFRFSQSGIQQTLRATDIIKRNDE